MLPCSRGIAVLGFAEFVLDNDALQWAFVRVKHPEGSDIGHLFSSIDDESVPSEAEARASYPIPQANLTRQVSHDAALVSHSVTVLLRGTNVEISTDAVEPENEAALVAADCAYDLVLC